jgi:hypothetical protein
MAELKLGPPKGKSFQIRTVPYFLVYLDCSAGENPADYMECFRKVDRRSSKLKVPALEAGTFSTTNRTNLLNGANFPRLRMLSAAWLCKR